MLEVVAGARGADRPDGVLPRRRREGRVLCSHETDEGRTCATKLLWTRVQGGVTKALAGTTVADLVEFTASSNEPKRAVADDRRLAPATRTETMAELEINDLHVSAEGKEILKGLDLERRQRRGPRADGAQRVRQVDARQRDHGPPGLEVTEGTITSTARTSPRPTPTSARGWASSWPSSTRSRSPASRSPSTCG